MIETIRVIYQYDMSITSQANSKFYEVKSTEMKSISFSNILGDILKYRDGRINKMGFFIQDCKSNQVGLFFHELYKLKNSLISVISLLFIK
jgi:hypothetical protein